MLMLPFLFRCRSCFSFFVFFLYFWLFAFGNGDGLRRKKEHNLRIYPTTTDIQSMRLLPRRRGIYQILASDLCRPSEEKFQDTEVEPAFAVEVRVAEAWVDEVEDDGVVGRGGGSGGMGGEGAEVEDLEEFGCFVSVVVGVKEGFWRRWKNGAEGDGDGGKGGGRIEGRRIRIRKGKGERRKKKEEGRRKKEEGRRKKEEGRRKKEEGRRKK